MPENEENCCSTAIERIGRNLSFGSQFFLLTGPKCVFRAGEMDRATSSTTGIELSLRLCNSALVCPRTDK